MTHFQSGFCAPHSMETALLKVSCDIMMSADSVKCTVLVLLDFSSLHQSVNHKILINRLQGLVGMSSPVSRCFSSYLVGRSFSVAGNHRISNPRIKLVVYLRVLSLACSSSFCTFSLLVRLSNILMMFPTTFLVIIYSYAAHLRHQRHIR